MLKEITFDAQEVLKIDLPPAEQKTVNPKIGFISGRQVIAIAILGCTSLLVATAAVVSAIFASYLVAALCTAALISLVLSTLAVSQIKPSQGVFDLIKRLTQKIKSLFNQIQELKKERDIPIIYPQEQELKKQIADLTKELDKKNQELVKLPQPDKIVDPEREQLNQLQLQFKEKEEAQELKKERDIPIIYPQEQELKKQIAELTKELDKKNQELVKLPQLDKKVDSEREQLIAENQLVKKQFNQLQLQLKEKEEAYVEKDESQNEIQDLKKQLVQKKDLVKRKEIKLILQEIFITEKIFNDNMTGLKEFFAILMHKKFKEPLSKKDCNRIYVELVKLIKESNALLHQLKIDDHGANFAKKIQACQEAFSQENLQEYIKAFETVVPQIPAIQKAFKEIENTPIGKQLIAEFSQKNKNALPEEYVNSIKSRILSQILLLEKLGDTLEDPNEGHLSNLQYLKDASVTINRLTPELDALQKFKA